MRIKVNRRQFQLLMDNFDILSDRGLRLLMNGSTFLYLFEKRKRKNS